MKEKDKENINEEISFDKEPVFAGEGKNVNPLQRKMALMSDKEYIEKRLDSQMDWYDRKASLFQKKFKTIRRWEIVIAASVPVLIAFANMTFLEQTYLIDKTIMLSDGTKQVTPILTLSTVFQIIVALGGIILIVLKGFNDLEDYFKNWKEYRLTEESLKQEKFKYITRTEPYDEADAFPLLVETVENILNNETQKWKLVSKPNNDVSEKALNSVNAQLDKLQNISDENKKQNL